MPVKTDMLPVKTKCSYQLPSSLHIAPTAHQVRDAEVCALNVFFILNPLLPGILLNLFPNSRKSMQALDLMIKTRSACSK